MAEDERRCGVGGVPFELPAPGEDMVRANRPPGQETGTPPASVSDPNPLKRMGISRIMGDRGVLKNYDIGSVMENDDGTATVNIVGADPITFDNAEDLKKYIYSRNAKITNELADYTDSQKFYSSFHSANSYSVASYPMKWLGLQMSSLFGNGPRAAEALEALRTFNNTGRLDELAASLERWRSLSRQERAHVLETLPQPALVRTPAGVLLEAAKWAETGLVNQNASMQEMAKRYDLDVNWQDMEDLQQRAKFAGIANPTSPVGKAFRQFRLAIGSEEAKRIGVDMDMMDKFAIVMDAPGRKWMVENNYKGALGKDTGIVGLARFDTENPSAFEHNGKVGAAGMEDFMSGLTPEQRAYMTGVHAHMMAFKKELDTQLFDANMITKDELKLRETILKNWVPQNELGKTNPTVRHMLGPVGRSTMAERPTAQFFAWADAASRAANINLYHQGLMKFFGQKDLEGIVTFNKKETIAGGGKFSYRIPMQDEHGIYVYDHADPEGDAVSVTRIDFNPAVWRGRMLQSALAPKTSSGAFGDHMDMLSNNPLRDGLSMFRGFTRFTSLMFTLAKPAWWLKSLAWNAGVAPVAFQSAFGLSTADATRALFGHDGRSGFLTNMPRMMRAMLGGKNATDKAWMDAFYKHAAGTQSDERYRDARIAGMLDYSSKTVRDLLAKPSPSNLLEGGRRAWNGYMHFQHTPDVAVQAAAFRTYIEHVAGKLNTPEEIERYLSQNNEVRLNAVSGSRRVMPNFSQTGAIGWTRTFFPFFNATLQTFPYAKQVFSSRYGQVAGLMALMAGYGMRQLYEEETGDKSSKLSGEDGALYFGDMVSVPVDYLMHPLLKMGASMYHVGNGTMSAKDAAIGVAKSVTDAFSPISAPQDIRSLPMWALMNATPPVYHAPILALTGTDEFGNPQIGDAVSTPNHERVEGAPNWMYDRPGTNTAAVQAARFMAWATGGAVDMAPGRIAIAAKSLIPVAPDLYNAISGETAAKTGGQPSIANTLRDIVAPNFRPQEADTFGGKAEFMSAYTNAIRSGVPSGLPTTRTNILTRGSAEARNAEAALQIVQAKVNAIRVNGMSSSDVNVALSDARRYNDHAKILALESVQHDIQERQNMLWQDAAMQQSTRE